MDADLDAEDPDAQGVRAVDASGSALRAGLALAAITLALGGLQSLFVHEHVGLSGLSLVRVWNSAVFVVGLLWFRDAYYARPSGDGALEACRGVFVGSFLGHGATALLLLLAPQAPMWAGVLVLGVCARVAMALRAAGLTVEMLDLRPEDPSLACPDCGWHPRTGEQFVCSGCRSPVRRRDPDCPVCAARLTRIRCAACEAEHPNATWRTADSDGGPPPA